jgi:hypothetical protein
MATMRKLPWRSFLAPLVMPPRVEPSCFAVGAEVEAEILAGDAVLFDWPLFRAEGYTDFHLRETEPS